MNLSHLAEVNHEYRMDYLQNELNVLEILHRKPHDNIAKTYDVYLEPRYDQLIMRMEYCPFGDLFDQIFRDEGDDSLRDEHKQLIVRDIIAGIGHLHTNVCYSGVATEHLETCSNKLSQLHARTKRLSKFRSNFLISIYNEDRISTPADV